MQYLGMSSVQTTMSVSVFSRSKQARASSTRVVLAVLLFITTQPYYYKRKRIITDALTL